MEDDPRDHVKLYILYMSMCPPEELCETPAFYLQILQKPSIVANGGRYWYSGKQPRGRNKISEATAYLCKKGGVPVPKIGKITNHSNRSEVIERMCDAGIGTKAQMEHTGHRSVMGISAYQTTGAQVADQRQRAILGQPPRETGPASLVPTASAVAACEVPSPARACVAVTAPVCEPNRAAVCEPNRAPTVRQLEAFYAGFGLAVPPMALPEPAPAPRPAPAPAPAPAPLALGPAPAGTAAPVSAAALQAALAQLTAGGQLQGATIHIHL